MWWLLACREEELPSLLPDLAGDWVGVVVTEAGEFDAGASLAWDEDEELLSGSFVVHEAVGSDADADRGFDLLDATSVEDLGVALHAIEQVGVRELFVDALTPLDPLLGVWRTRWFCAESADGWCHDDGTVSLDRQ